MEICKLKSVKAIEGSSPGYVATLAKRDGGEKDVFVTNARLGAELMSFRHSQLRLADDGEVSLLSGELIAKGANAAVKDGAATYEGKIGQHRHPTTGRFTGNAATVYRDAMTAHINSAPNFDDSVMTQARKVARQAVKDAGFDVDDIVTGSHNDDPSLDPRRVANTPEPSSKSYSIDDINKLLTSVRENAAAGHERVLLKRANAGDGLALDEVLRTRLGRDRASAPGWTSLLKDDDLRGPVESVMGAPFHSPGIIEKRDETDAIEARIRKGQTLEGDELVGALTKRLARAALPDVTDVWRNGGEYPAATAYTPASKVGIPWLDQDNQQFEALIKRLRNREDEGVSGVEKLLR